MSIQEDGPSHEWMRGYVSGLHDALRIFRKYVADRPIPIYVARALDCVFSVSQNPRWPE